MKIDFRLYLITGSHFCENENILPVARVACAAGIKAIQLREKGWSARQVFETATQLKEICGASRTKLFINDRADIADAVGADGIHLTSQSLPVSVVRNFVTFPKLIGVSTHSLAEAALAEANGADFIVFGPIFDTPSKRVYGSPQGLEKLKQVAKGVRIPVFAVGGIDSERAFQCRKNGAWGVALISAIMSADNITKKILEFETALGSL